MLKRRVAALLGAAAVVALAVGSTPVPAQNMTVMTSVPSLGFPFFVHMMKSLVDEAKSLGVRTVESDGQNSAPKQTADVEAAVVQGVAGIVISPLDVNAMAPAIKTAIDNGVPVVTIDRRVAGRRGHHRARRCGQREGRRGPGPLGDGDLPERGLHREPPGPARRSPAIDRNKGLHNVLDAHKDKYRFVAEQTANFARDQGLNVTESLMAGMGTPPDVIVAANDDMALGAHRGGEGPEPGRQGAGDRLRRSALRRWRRCATASSPARSSSSRAGRAARPCGSWSST
jgi:ABC-type sugar transport system substrate-binding protein